MNQSAPSYPEPTGLLNSLCTFVHTSLLVAATTMTFLSPAQFHRSRLSAKAFRGADAGVKDRMTGSLGSLRRSGSPGHRSCRSREMCIYLLTLLDICKQL